MFGSEILCVTPSVNTNGSLLKVKNTTLTEMKTKPVVLIIRIKSKLKLKLLGKVRSTIAKMKLKQKFKNTFWKIVDNKGSACNKTKKHMLLQQNKKSGKWKVSKIIRRIWVISEDKMQSNIYQMPVQYYILMQQVLILFLGFFDSDNWSLDILPFRQSHYPGRQGLRFNVLFKTDQLFFMNTIWMKILSIF